MYYKRPDKLLPLLSFFLYRDIEIKKWSITTVYRFFKKFLTEWNAYKAPIFFFLQNFVMASSCTQMCLQCRRLLFSRTTVCVWSSSTQLGHCYSSASSTPKFPNRSLVARGNLTTTQPREKYRQQLFCVSGLSVKHLSTEAEGVKDREELSRADIVPYKSPLSPIRDVHPANQSQRSLGEPCDILY